MEWFLRAHAVPGLEAYDDTGYARTLPLSDGPALLSLRFHETEVVVGLTGSRVLPEAVALTRRLLDLDTDGAAVDARLSADPALAQAVSAAPGLRVPGAVDGWELLLRTMLGQQISLAAARTHQARLVARLGDPVGPGFEGGWRLFPTAEAVAGSGAQVLTGPRRRVAAVLAVAEAVAAGDVDLSPGRDPGRLRADLVALPGVGPWTADYVVMRLAPDPDVLLAGDLVVRQGATALRLQPADLADRARWSPDRSYATMHLWRVALAAREQGR